MVLFKLKGLTVQTVSVLIHPSAGFTLLFFVAICGHICSAILSSPAMSPRCVSIFRLRDLDREQTESLIGVSDGHQGSARASDS